MSLSVKLETVLLSSSNLTSTITATSVAAEEKNPLAAIILNALANDAIEINNKIYDLIEAIEQTDTVHKRNHVFDN